MNDDFVCEIAKRLNSIRETSEMVDRLRHLRLFCSGTKRDAYTEVIKTELFRMLKEVDDFKVFVLAGTDDVDSEALLNITRFPTINSNYFQTILTQRQSDFPYQKETSQ